MLHADLGHRPACDISKPENVARYAALNDVLCSYFANRLIAAGSKVVEKGSLPITDDNFIAEVAKIYECYGDLPHTAAVHAERELKAARAALESVCGIQVSG